MVLTAPEVLRLFRRYTHTETCRNVAAFLLAVQEENPDGPWYSMVLSRGPRFFSLAVIVAIAMGATTEIFFSLMATPPDAAAWPWGHGNLLG